MSTGRMLVAVAGPAMNLVMAIAVSHRHRRGRPSCTRPIACCKALFDYLVGLNISS